MAVRIAALSGWTSEQKHVVAASFLGWTLDAFDFVLLLFVLKDIAEEFKTDITDVTFAILLTLTMRPIGAYLFGRAADRWGRRPILMVNVLCYSVIEFASGFSPNLTTLLILRAIFGIAMGGEWGVGASLTMESIPPHARGLVSGLLQSGYPMGYFLASIVYGLLFQYIGWRGMFMVGVIPALLVFYIRRSVPESPSWTPTTASSNTLAILKSHWRLGVYSVLLMTARAAQRRSRPEDAGKCRAFAQLTLEPISSGTAQPGRRRSRVAHWSSVGACQGPSLRFQVKDRADAGVATKALPRTCLPARSRPALPEGLGPQARAVLSYPDARGGEDEPSTAGIHRWTWRHGGMAVRGARAAAEDAGYRISQRQVG